MVDSIESLIEVSSKKIKNETKSNCSRNQSLEPKDWIHSKKNVKIRYIQVKFKSLIKRAQSKPLLKNKKQLRSMMYVFKIFQILINKILILTFKKEEVYDAKFLKKLLIAFEKAVSNNYEQRTRHSDEPLK